MAMPSDTGSTSALGIAAATESNVESQLPTLTILASLVLVSNPSGYHRCCSLLWNAAAVTLEKENPVPWMSVCEARKSGPVPTPALVSRSLPERSVWVRTGASE